LAVIRERTTCVERIDDCVCFEPELGIVPVVIFDPELGTVRFVCLESDDGTPRGARRLGVTIFGASFDLASPDLDSAEPFVMDRSAPGIRTLTSLSGDFSSRADSCRDLSTAARFSLLCAVRSSETD
jgi:hypothetical protein